MAGPCNDKYACRCDDPDCTANGHVVLSNDGYETVFAKAEREEIERQKAELKKYEDARANGIPASTINGCSCDFCTGKKKHEDNYCSYCAEVKMEPPKNWLNLDMCDECEVLFKERMEKERDVTSPVGG